MKNQNNSGFTAVEVILIIVIVGIIGGTGWFVLRGQQNINKTFNNTGNSTASPNPTKTGIVTNFDDCQKQAGSKMLETYPEQCVTKGGQSFTQAASYLTIKEWGIRIKLGDPTISDAYYLIKSGVPDVAYLSLNSFKGTDCDAEGVTEGAIIRYTSTDKSDEGVLQTDLYGTANRIGNYYYAYIHQQATCSNNQATQDKANAASDAFKSAVTTVQATN